MSGLDWVLDRTTVRARTVLDVVQGALYRAFENPSPCRALRLKTRRQPADVPMAPPGAVQGTNDMERTMPESTNNVVKVMCPNLGCQRILAVPARARGEVVRCRGCNTNIRIPEPRSGDDRPRRGASRPSWAA